MGAQEVTVTLSGAVRGTNTREGNPRWRLFTGEGEYATEPDAQVGFDVVNHAGDTSTAGGSPTESWLGRRVVLTLNESGRVTGWRLADPVAGAVDAAAGAARAAGEVRALLDAHPWGPRSTG